MCDKNLAIVGILVSISLAYIGINGFIEYKTEYNEIQSQIKQEYYISITSNATLIDKINTIKTLCNVYSTEPMWCINDLKKEIKFKHGD